MTWSDYFVSQDQSELQVWAKTSLDFTDDVPLLSLDRLLLGVCYHALRKVGASQRSGFWIYQFV